MNSVDIVVGILGNGLRFGEPQRSGPLTLVPAFGEKAGPAYRLFAGAAAEGLVSVAETGGGSVPELTVVNRAGCAVLLLEGEVLGGLRQTRTLNATVLVPPQATLTIPVSCVEAGRWGAARPMAREALHASPRVRASKNAGVQRQVRCGAGYRSDQAEVWKEVGRHLELHCVDSATASYADVHRMRLGAIEEVAASLRPAPGQTGVLALAGARPLAFDVFDRPDTLASVWAGLVGSYAADALVTPGGEGAADAARAAGLAAGLARGRSSTHPAVGMGEVVFLSAPDVVVSALVVDSALVHLAAVWSPDATAELSPESVPAGGRRSWFGEAQ